MESFYSSYSTYASSVSYAFPGPLPSGSADSNASNALRGPDDRSATFQPVEGGTEHRSGETLLVAAYAGLWVLLMGWVLVQWTKQTALARRVEDLEAAVADAGRAEDLRAGVAGGAVPNAAHARAHGTEGALDADGTETRKAPKTREA